MNRLHLNLIRSKQNKCLNANDAQLASLSRYNQSYYSFDPLEVVQLAFLFNCDQSIQPACPLMNSSSDLSAPL